MAKHLRSADRIKLNSFNDLFGETVEADNIGEKLIEVPLTELHEFKGHPFQVRDDEEMEKLVESIREYGVLHPGIARPLKKGKGYELIAGHRRKYASEKAGKEKMPVFVRNYDNDEATIIMVDSNLQREVILPSEKARAYRMKFNALKHQGKGGGLSIDKLGESAGESGKQVQRYIRLSYLNDDLLKMVDDGKIKLVPGVALSYLRASEQEELVRLTEREKPDFSIAKTNALKKASQESELSVNEIRNILCEEKHISRNVVLSEKRLRKFFSNDEKNTDIQELIYKLLEHWSKGEYGDV